MNSDLNNSDAGRLNTAFILVCIAAFLPFIHNFTRYIPPELPIQIRLFFSILITQGTLLMAVFLPFIIRPVNPKQICDALGLKKITKNELLRILKLSLPVFLIITAFSSLLTGAAKFFGEKNPEQPLVELMVKSPLPVFFTIAATAVFLAPVVEELAFRRVLFYGLRKSFPPITAAVVTSLLFAVIHAAVWQMPALFFLALIFQWEYMRARENTTYTMLMHGIYNFITILCAFGLRLYHA